MQDHRLNPKRVGRIRGVRIAVIALFALAWAKEAAAADGGARARGDIAILGVSVVDVAHGRTFGPRTVLIHDGRITAVGTPRSVRVPPRSVRVAARGLYLIPGLVDMHVHLFNLSSHRPDNDWSFPLFVANGVTGIREMRGNAATMVQVRRWRAQVDSGELVAPHILAAGVAVQGESPDEARRQVNAAVAAGADFIKVFSEIPEANWRAALAATQVRGLPLVGHVPAGVGLVAAAAAGQRSAEHLYQAYEACSSIEADLLASRLQLAGEALSARRDEQEARVLDAFDQAACERAAKALGSMPPLSQQVQVPTLALADEDDFAAAAAPESNPNWRYLRPDERLRWQRFRAGYTPADAELARKRWPIAYRIVAILRAAKVPILAGTDAPMPGVVPGFSLHDELARLVAAGLTPREALWSATLGPARFLGIDERAGHIAPGQRADLVLLEADPLQDIGNTRRIRAVILDGRLLRRTDLHALLEDAARAQAR